MKKISLFIVMLCALSFVEVSAQKNVVRWSPLATVKMKAKVHYERALTDKLSAGAIGSYFFGALLSFLFFEKSTKIGAATKMEE